jgi:hypothetical protein
MGHLNLPKESIEHKGPRAGTLLPLSYWRDPQILSLSVHGRDLLVRMLSYSADYTTDGLIPASMVLMLVAADPEGGLIVLGELADHGELVRKADGSCLLVRWREFNLSSEEVAARRRQTAEAGQKGGAQRIATAKRDHLGRVLSRTQANKPDESPDESPDGRLDVQPDGVQTTPQAGTQTRLPSPVSRIPYPGHLRPSIEAVSDPTTDVVGPPPASRHRPRQTKWERDEWIAVDGAAQQVLAPTNSTADAKPRCSTCGHRMVETPQGQFVCTYFPGHPVETTSLPGVLS